MRAAALVLFALATAVDAHAQASEATRSWTFDASLWGYIVPEDDDYLQPTVAADHHWLHLEGRYNYEAPNTGSAWFGYNLSTGSTVTFELTPMAGLVIGGLTGAAPGYELTVGWWKLEFASEGEFVFDFGDSENNFFYNWSQLGISPVDWLQLGISIQRTRAYQTERDIQRGFFGSITWKALYFSGFVFNPDDSPTVVLAVGFSY